MDYFWLFAGVWATIGALLSGLLIRRLDVSRIGYNDARQLLSAIVSALSVRIQKVEFLMKHLSDEIEMIKASRTQGVTEPTVDTRLLEYVREWGTNVKQVMERLDELQRKLTRIDIELQDVWAAFDRMKAPEASAGAEATDLGVVTEDTFRKLSATERQVLLLLYEGPRSAPEIGELAGRSREHSARLMKVLFEQGFVERETNRQPYRYTLNGKVREALLSQRTFQNACSV